MTHPGVGWSFQLSPSLFARNGRYNFKATAAEMQYINARLIDWNRIVFREAHDCISRAGRFDPAEDASRLMDPASCATSIPRHHRRHDLLAGWIAGFNEYPDFG
jgi:hypothetical protein